MTNRSRCIGVLLSLAPALVLAQEAPPPPKVVTIIREEIKPGHEAAHVKTESGWPRAFAKAKSPTMYLAFQSLSGKPVVNFVTGYASFEAWQQDMDWQAKNSTLSADLSALGEPDGQHLTGMHRWVAVLDEASSFQPAYDWSKARYVRVLTIRMRPGFGDGFGAIAKGFADAYRKAGIDSRWSAFAVTDGEMTPTYFIVTPMRSLSEIDQDMANDPKIVGALGEEGMQRFQRFAKEGILSMESMILAPSPAMSYVTKEFAAGDPEFWSKARTTSGGGAATSDTKRNP